MSELDTKPARFSRRQLLIAGGTLFAGLTASAVAANWDRLKNAAEFFANLQDTKEKLRQVGDNTVLIDFAPHQLTDGIHQTAYPNNEEVIGRILGDRYVSPATIAKEFGLEFLRPGGVQAESLRKLFERYPENALLRAGFSQFENHSTLVAQARSKIMTRYGYDPGSVEIIPLQNFFSDKTVTVTKDEIDNQMVKLHIVPDQIIEALRQYPNQRMVCFPFQAGELHMVYTKRWEKIDWDKYGDIAATSHEVDGNGKLWYAPHEGKATFFQKQPDGSLKAFSGKQEIPLMSEEDYLKERARILHEATTIAELEEPRIDITGAYDAAHAKDNLLLLHEIARAYPDKLFFAAGGNYQDDLRAARAELEAGGKWRDNVVLMAQWWDDLGGPRNQVHGVDIYVDNNNLDLPWGSTFSTATIQSIGSVLADQGLPNDGIIRKLFSYCEKLPYAIYDARHNEYAQTEALVFNPEKVDIV